MTGPVLIDWLNEICVLPSSKTFLTPAMVRGPQSFNDYSPESPSPLSSRKTSWESAKRRDGLNGLFFSPFGDANARSREGSDDINTQTASQKYNIIPSPDLIIHPEDVEMDDYLHNPDPNEPDRNTCDIWSKRGMNVGGWIIVTLGVLALFVSYPVLYDLVISLSLLADKYTWKIDHRSLRPNGNVGQRVMPQEPMAIIMNFGISNSFAQVFLANLAELLPASMRIDYIRVHQDSSQVSLTCDPEGYETTEYIRRHSEAYNNPNLTLWKDAGYSWPRNTLVDECKL
ncbi:glycoside hydrolase family 16 protein [Oidiodendron maius Zn]|uniref:Glycoside hydrolase family 16 protein n=1 Tax=Oidiodendron maius (strain Zn) TaxID=913774 RepID=A0A0C3HTP4_OIDMZ|nr:glycoside hydrolase family 16 protein [Oidiodendron maius Zn]